MIDLNPQQSSTSAEVLTTRDLNVAARALQHACRYDSMRLETYLQNENLGGRVRISSIGSATALRFDDVGYFNRVYCSDDTVFERLPEIEEFYRESLFGCELVGPPAAGCDTGDRTIHRPGWEPSNRYAWMHTANPRAFPDKPSTAFSVCPVEPSQREQFLLTYLRGFEAQQDRFPAALRNMRHLFDWPDLDCLMAWHGAEAAGVAMMRRCGGAALFCAGAALPDFREKGCHAALLAARIRLAAAYGCGELYSWTVLAGQSQANMEKAGLACVGVTQAWRFSPARR